jgi:deoxycytidylate deaminase
MQYTVGDIKYSYQEAEVFFNRAFQYAEDNTTCLKVPVGALYKTPNGLNYLACNNTNNGPEGNCCQNGECYKAKVTGIYESCEETRKYCQSTHAEINMINILKQNNINPTDGTLFVTRYPCWKCAKSIISYGFKEVHYCGKVEASGEVKQLFDDNNVRFFWYPNIDFEY